MKCYGTYSKSKKDCRLCENLHFCKESTYKPKNVVDFSKLENYKDFSTSQTAYEELVQKEADLKSIKNSKKKVALIVAELLMEASGEHVESILFVLLPIFQKLYKYDPRTLRIILNKMQNPHKSYRQIGIEEQTSKQVVNFHIKKAKQIEPNLDNALLINRRCLPYYTPPVYQKNDSYKIQFTATHKMEQLAFDF